MASFCGPRTAGQLNLSVVLSFHCSAQIMWCRSLRFCHLRIIDADECCYLIRIHAVQMMFHPCGLDLVHTTGLLNTSVPSDCSRVVFVIVSCLFVKCSAPGWRLYPQRPSVRRPEEEPDLEFCRVCHSCGGSGPGLGLSGRSSLCLLQTGRADIQEQGSHGFHMLQPFLFPP